MISAVLARHADHAPDLRNMPEAMRSLRKPVCMEYGRDVLGNRVPVYTNLEGDALNDTATGYEAGLISGQ